jgi:hypothetical protein
VLIWDREAKQMLINLRGPSRRAMELAIGKANEELDAHIPAVRAAYNTYLAANKLLIKEFYAALPTDLKAPNFDFNLSPDHIYSNPYYYSTKRQEVHNQRAKMADDLHKLRCFLLSKQSTPKAPKVDDAANKLLKDFDASRQLTAGTIVTEGTVE